MNTPHAVEQVFHPPYPAELEANAALAAAYEALKNYVLANNWAQAPVEQILRAFADPNGEPPLPINNQPLLLWILVEELGRWDAFLELFRKDPFQIALTHRLIIPQLKIPKDHMTNLIVGIQDEVIRDLFGYKVFTVTSQWASSNPLAAQEIAMEANQLALGFRQALLLGLLEAANGEELFEAAFAHSRNSSPETYPLALLLLPEVVKRSWLSDEEAVSMLQKALSNTDAITLSSAMHSLQMLLEQRPEAIYIDMLPTLLEDPRETVKSRLLETLSFSQHSILLEFRGRLLQSLINTPLSDQSLIQGIDTLLSKIIEHGDLDTFEKFMGQWVRSHPKVSPDSLIQQVFVHTFHSLNKCTELPRIATRWAISSTKEALLAATLLNANSIEGYDLQSIAPVTDQIFRVLVWRTLALTLDPQWLLPRLASLTAVATTTPREEMLLEACRELAVDFRQSSLQWANTHQATNTTEGKMVEVIRARHDEYFTALESLDTPREFYPSPQRRVKFLDNFQRLQAESWQEVSSRHVFLISHIPRISVGRGDQWVAHYQNAPEDNQLHLTKEAEYKSFSVSLEGSRLELIEGEIWCFRRHGRQLKNGTGD